MRQHKSFTKGDIKKHIFYFSIPIMFANLLQVSYQFIDSLWVGNLIGENALGSVSVASTVIFVALSFIIGFNNATLTILSQQKGKEDRLGLAKYLNAFVFLLIGLSLIIGLVGYIFAEKVLQLLNTPLDMIYEAKTYLQINTLGIAFLVGYNFIGTVMRAVGDSITPLKIVLGAVILNTVLDPILIYNANLGVNGAALATVIAQGTAFLVGLAYVLKNKLVPFSKPSIPAKEEVLTILKLGIPSGLQMSVISTGVAAITSVVNSFGPAVVSGFSAAQRLDSIIMLPAQALGTAVTSIAGQNIGMNKWDRVFKTSRFGMIYNFSTMIPIAAVIYIFAEPAIKLFIQEPQSVAFGKQYLQTIALFYPF